MSRLVDVYPYCKEQGRAKLLIFKRSNDVQYPNQWRMVGGKVEGNEKRYEAALRELNEEAGIRPHNFWVLPSLNQFYDPQSDTIHRVPAFAAEVNPHDDITLNHEHCEYRWIAPSDIEQYIDWPEQQRLMKLLSEIVTNNKILDEWIIQFSK